MTGPGERVRVLYSGNVQGVGFRWRVFDSARTLSATGPVTGFVENLADGRVELVAEGPKDDLERLLAEVRRRMGDLISSEAVSWDAATGEFRGFDVRR